MYKPANSDNSKTLIYQNYFQKYLQNGILLKCFRKTFSRYRILYFQKYFWNFFLNQWLGLQVLSIIVTRSQGSRSASRVWLAFQKLTCKDDYRSAQQIDLES